MCLTPPTYGEKGQSGCLPLTYKKNLTLSIALASVSFSLALLKLKGLSV